VRAHMSAHSELVIATSTSQCFPFLTIG